MLRHMRTHVKAIMITVIVLFVASCFAGYGMYSRSGNKRSGEGITDYPVAEAGGRSVMRSEIENGIGRVAEQYGVKEVTSKDLPLFRQSVLDGIVIQNEITKEIKAKKISVNKDEIDAEYIKMMDQYPTREEFMANLQRVGMTEKQVKEDIKKQMSEQKLLESIVTDVAVTDEEAHAFYDSTKSFLYKQQAGAKANVATFKNNEAAKLAQKALAEGAAWDKIMDEHKADIDSSTPYASPIVITDQMTTQSPSLAKVKELKDGEVSAVIPVGTTASILAVGRGKSQERVLSYSEVSKDVTEAIKNQKTQQKQNEYFRTLRERAVVKILDATIFPEEPKKEQAKSEDKSE